MLRDVVLVVDQDAMMCNLASMILSRQGFEVVTAVNGRTAAELCRARKVPIVVAVIDLSLQAPDARETIRILRQIHPELAIVITSAQPGIDGAATAADLQADAFLAKPYRSRKLVEAVMMALVRRAAPGGKLNLTPVRRREQGRPGDGPANQS